MPEPREPAGGAERAARAFRAALPEQLVETDLSAFDATGAAVWSVALLAAPGGNGVGYGSDRAAARASAYGELVEWTRSHAVLSAAVPRTGSLSQLRAAGLTVADPRTLCLPAGSAWTPDAPLEWLPATRRRDGASVWVPVDLLASRGVDRPAPASGERLVTPITNGLGAGLDPARALCHALLELLQRDGNGLVFRALDTGAVVDLEGLADAAALDALERLRAAGVEPLVKLASTDLGVVDLYAVGREGPGGAGDEPITASAIGEAAHPDREAAVRKALLELCSSRARKAFAHGDLDRVRRLAGGTYLEDYLASLGPDPLAAEEPRALAATREWLALPPGELATRLEPTLFAERSRVALADLPAAPALRDGESADGLLAVLEGALSAAGLDDVLVLDLSGDGVSAVKVLVPGLEVETMSYGRIGERGVVRALELDLPFVRVGEDPGGWSPVLLTPEATERLGGPAWLDRGAVDALVDGVYPLYREPSRHVARLGAR